jgi:hypothetical protein
LLTRGAGVGRGVRTGDRGGCVLGAGPLRRVGEEVTLAARGTVSGRAAGTGAGCGGGGLALDVPPDELDVDEEEVPELEGRGAVFWFDPRAGGLALRTGGRGEAGICWYWYSCVATELVCVGPSSRPPRTCVLAELSESTSLACWTGDGGCGSFCAEALRTSVVSMRDAAMPSLPQAVCTNPSVRASVGDGGGG